MIAVGARATTPEQLQLKANRSRSPIGAVVRFRVALRIDVDDQRSNSRRVLLQERRSGIWRAVNAGRIDQTGLLRLNWRAKTAGTHLFRAVARRTRSQDRLVSTHIPVRVTKMRHSFARLEAFPTTVTAGQPVTLTVSLWPRAARSGRVQIKGPGHPQWSTIASVSANPGGAITVPAPDPSGQFLIRIDFPEKVKDGLRAVISTKVRLLVQASKPPAG